jgi:hypothetical protein
MRLLFSKAVDVLGAVTVNRSVKTFPYYSYEVVKLLGIDIDYFSLFVEMVLLLYVKVLHMCYCNPHR